MKGNQERLKEDIATVFEHDESIMRYESPAEKGHGRIEMRTIEVFDIGDKPEYQEHFKQWSGLKQICKLTNIREKKGKTSTAVLYAITSLCAKNVSPSKLLNIARDHWKIENILHRTRDTLWHEDASTVRKNNAPQAMAAIRNLAICQLKKAGESFVEVTELAHSNTNFPIQLMRQII